MYIGKETAISCAEIAIDISTRDISSNKDYKYDCDYQQFLYMCVFNGHI